MKKINIIGLLLLILISSCRKDINEVTENVTTDPPEVLIYNPAVDNISGSLIGLVVDENNEPMSDVKIKMNGEDYFTNELGHFIIEDVTMNSLGQYVEAFQNATHFPGSRRFFPQEGKTSQIKIQMIKKEFNYEFSAQEEATVLIEGGAQVEFTPNSIRDANGNIYEGTVMVASHYLDPLERETFDQMPGNLQGVNTLSEEVALQTFGMIAVELESPNGEKLNIADGNSATITMPVSDELLAIAPEEIPLWSFNTEYGLWHEESSATLQNNTYVGKVEHFSFWNCDYPYPIVPVDVTFVDTDGNPLEWYFVQVELQNGAVGTGTTLNTGTVHGMFPANEILTFSLLDHCGNVIFSQDFGPFSTSTSLGPIEVTNPYANNTTIKGTLRDCDNNLVQNGFVIVNIDGYPYYHYVTGGEFEFFVTPCSADTDLEVYGVNLDNFEQSSIVTATPQSVNDLGELSVCGNNSNNVLTLTIDGETKVIFDLTVNVNAGGGNGTYMYTEGTNLFIGIGFGGTDVGDYSDNNFIEGISIDDWNIWQTSTTSPFTSFTVTEFDTKLVGTFSGDVENNGVPVFLEGEFSITL